MIIDGVTQPEGGKFNIYVNAGVPGQAPARTADLLEAALTDTTMAVDLTACNQ